MANEIKCRYQSGLNLYAIIRNSSGQAWYISGLTFEDWGGGAGRDADDYDISLTDKSGSMYIADMPSNLPAGYYDIMKYQRAGANPDDSDYAIDNEYGYWTGTSWITNAIALQTIDALIDAIKAKTDNLPSDPADQSAIEAAITAAHSTTNGKIDAIVAGNPINIEHDTTLISRFDG